MALVAAVETADLALPYCLKWASIAVVAAPGDQAPLGPLNNSKLMLGALVGHDDFLLEYRSEFQFLEISFPHRLFESQRGRRGGGRLLRLSEG